MKVSFSSILQYSLPIGRPLAVVASASSPGKIKRRSDASIGLPGGGVITRGTSLRLRRRSIYPGK